jgi:GNAT superfamily N-acetyltransferase
MECTAQEYSIREISALEAASFRDNPAYRQVFRCSSDEEFRRQIEFFFEKNFDGLLLGDPNCIHVFKSDVDGKPKTVCAFVLTRSDRHATFWQMIWAGVWWLMYEAGWNTFQRILRAGDYYDKLEADTMGDRLHYTLHRMVVDPAMQGKGFGSKCLQQVICRIAEEDKLPIFLTTQKEKNVQFYEKLGFQLVSKHPFSYTNGDNVSIDYVDYVMVREPR